MKTKRNGKIELYRFLFSVIIVLFHCAEHLLYKGKIVYTNRFDLSFFTHGALGVEFFFLVTGYLLAVYVSKKVKDSKKKKIDSESLFKETIEFMKKKISSIFPQHIVAFIIAFISISVATKAGILDIAKRLICSIPQFFFIQMSGIKVNDMYPNNIEWYISAMLICLFIIYPILRKYFHGFSKFGAPIIGVLIIGYINLNFRSIIPGVFRLTNNSIFYVGLLRAFAEICLGIFIYTIVDYISNKKLTKKESIFLLLVELGTFCLTLLYICSELSKAYEIIALIMIFTFVTIAFSKKSYLSEKFDNKFFYFLGKISLPIYLSHLSAIKLVKYFMLEEIFIIQLSVVIVITIIFTTIVYLLGNLIGKISKKKLINN